MAFGNQDKYNGGWYQGKKSGTGKYLVTLFLYHFTFEVPKRR